MKTLALSVTDVSHDSHLTLTVPRHVPSLGFHLIMEPEEVVENAGSFRYRKFISTKNGGNGRYVHAQQNKEADKSQNKKIYFNGNFFPYYVQEGECPNRLDPQNPLYVEETGPSVIVNGFSERLRVSHSQRIRPNSESLVRSRPLSVPVQLALVNSHQIRSLVSVGDGIPRSTDFVFHVLPPSAPHLDLGGLSPVLQYDMIVDISDPKTSTKELLQLINTFRTSILDPATATMLMPKNNHIAIYELIFKEEVMVAKDVHMPKHP
ncbi:hypothetical protein U0070_013322 [Myodes glareolus]|uniref:Uncharacterized protein n=1 Tax=Myodes glareolus TaxID=447135 RepID=A0AAW0JTP4_MYOGA